MCFRNELGRRLILVRDPTSVKRGLAERFFQAGDDLSRLDDYSLALFNSNAFLYVD